MPAPSIVVRQLEASEAGPAAALQSAPSSASPDMPLIATGRPKRTRAQRKPNVSDFEDIEGRSLQNRKQEFHQPSLLHDCCRPPTLPAVHST